MLIRRHLAQCSAMGSILPAHVVTAETVEDLPNAELYPEEEAAIHHAGMGRRREFATVRQCARVALAGLGLPAAPIVPGADREPQWPDGVVGSLTHCDGYRAAALARDTDVASVGIDAEPHDSLPDRVLPMIAGPDESRHLSRLRSEIPEVHWDRLMFSAKESVYKAWFPLARTWLDFKEATVAFDPATRTFEAELHRSGAFVDGRPVTRLTGRWLVRNSLVFTSTILTRSRPVLSDEHSGRVFGADGGLCAVGGSRQ
ncbi:4'-phosphopantetheinyl transferase [Streptomyces sp. NPDC001544]|uniref:4'-phosphopantetheinyl transferase family protein n=1 Tax=Streptomyces sp. NPDC001544 TaxID=3364584 RepID=UPI0036B8F2EE